LCIFSKFYITDTPDELLSLALGIVRYIFQKKKKDNSKENKGDKK
jgi:hypothetical protein